jgi:hypothetical protein
VGGPTGASTAEALTGVLLDEMYPPALAKRLRDKGYDVLAVLDVEVGLASRSDDDVLAWAARNNRCVVTENIRDFARPPRGEATTRPGWRDLAGAQRIERFAYRHKPRHV